MVDFYEVTVKRVRGSTTGFMPRYVGHIVGLPEVGSRMLIIDRKSDLKLNTSPVTRVFLVGKWMYVETQNSLYHLEIGEKADLDKMSNRGEAHAQHR
jgi:hypothetical protein